MTTPADYHRCAVCTKAIAPHLLMCLRHWRLVPEALQRRVNRTWRAWQGAAARGAKLQLGREYQRARDAAVQAVTPQLGEIPAADTPTDLSNGGAECPPSQK